MGPIPIHNGPSKWDLILAMFDPSPHGEGRVLTFQSEDVGEMEIVIKTVKCNAASDYVFAGWVRESNIANVPVDNYVVGTYSTQRRKGKITGVFPTIHGLPRI